MTGNYRKGTPTKALEIILNIPPIDTYLKAEALKSNYRLIGTSDDRPSRNGHRQLADEKLHSLGINLETGDYIGKERIWKQNYTFNEDKSGRDIH